MFKPWFINFAQCFHLCSIFKLWFIYFQQCFSNLFNIKLFPYVCVAVFKSVCCRLFVCGWGIQWQNAYYHTLTSVKEVAGITFHFYPFTTYRKSATYDFENILSSTRKISINGSLIIK